MKVDYKLYKIRIRYLVFLTIIYSNIVIAHIISYDINIIYFKLLQFDPFVHFLCKVVGVGGPFRAFFLEKNAMKSKVFWSLHFTVKSFWLLYVFGLSLHTPFYR